jgi:hypothetical protein
LIGWNIIFAPEPNFRCCSKRSQGLHKCIMFDPLSESATPFANDDPNPSWPASPQDSTPSFANFGRADSSFPPTTPQKGPGEGLYGKEPQIYGQPEPGLISEAIGSDGTRFEKMEPYLRVRITGLDRNRRDILVRLDAQVSYPWCMYAICLICSRI